MIQQASEIKQRVPVPLSCRSMRLTIKKCRLHLLDKESGKQQVDDCTNQAVEWVCQGTDNSGWYLFFGARVNALAKQYLKFPNKSWELTKDVLFLEIEYEWGEDGRRERVGIVSGEEHFWVRPELVRHLAGAYEEDKGEDKDASEQNLLQWSLPSLRALWFKSAALGDVPRLRALRRAMGTRVAVDAVCGPDFQPPPAAGALAKPLDDPAVTALMLACYFAHQEAVVELLAQGADLNCVTGKFGDNAFMYACKRQTQANLDLSRYLLSQVRGSMHFTSISRA